MNDPLISKVNSVIEASEARFLEMKRISKVFSGVTALKGVDLRVSKGEIHAIVGENGAGKSTLMKILGGVYHPDSGDIYLDGRTVALTKPIVALAQGIAVIYQDLNVYPHLNVLENVWMGRYPRRGHFLTDWGAMLRMTTEILDRLKAKFHARDIVGQLSIADRQLVVIARGLSYNPKILVFDEPTSSLTPKETEALFGTIRNLASQGVTIIFISHHLSEVIDLADSITVLRDGEVVGNYRRGQIDVHSLAQVMVGRKIDNDYYRKHSSHSDTVLLEVQGISFRQRVKDVSFSLRRGEILGVAGLVGSGRSELAHCIYGSLKPDSGLVKKNGKRLTVRSPRDALKSGIVLVPEDRQDQGLILNKSLRFNITLPILNEVTRFGLISGSKERLLTLKLIKDLAIRTKGPDQEVQELSGGNQQKVLLAKAIVAKPEVMILDEPTRGVDIGARAEIHKIIRDLASTGMGILFISSDLPEIVGMCDRVLVMHEGAATALLEAEEIDPTAIMIAAAGGAGYVHENRHNTVA